LTNRDHTSPAPTNKGRTRSVQPPPPGDGRGVGDRIGPKPRAGSTRPNNSMAMEKTRRKRTSPTGRTRTLFLSWVGCDDMSELSRVLRGKSREIINLLWEPLLWVEGRAAFAKGLRNGIESQVYQLTKECLDPRLLVRGTGVWGTCIAGGLCL